MATLRSLLTWEADDPDDNVILHRIIRLVKNQLPSGWLEWKIRILTKEDLLGGELDPQVLNKIRFAIPTVGLARAFLPDRTSLSERSFRDIKVKLLEWPLCVGLIIHPMCLAARIRGSAVQNELMTAAITNMKPLLISREAANRELSDQSEDEVSLPSARSSAKSRKISRLEKVEKDQQEMKVMMEQFVQSFQPTHTESYSDDDSVSQYLSEEEVDISQQAAPSPKPWVPPTADEEEEFGWSATTKQQDPSIPAPKPNIAAQGSECQRLGDISFNQIRYAEVQKKLHACPVFAPLKINPILTTYVSSAGHENLVRTDYALGTITHGLLLQREALSNTLKELATKHPAMKEDLKKVLGAESPLKSVSDDLLQYVCGRRSEVIEQRRNALLPKDEYQSSLLNAIPPSTTHLFCEKQLAELLKQPSHQTFFRTPYKRPLQPKHNGFRSSARQARPTEKGPKTSSAKFNRPRRTFDKENENSKKRDRSQPTSRKKASKENPAKGHSSKKHKSF
ncbi:uncharacterized protein LOC132901969 [Amyelois transitella]|uniref:uncharacterized protein LOC132901969 n=1 Tax=Amyelois transitella TaxID=680683 RepID=UPI00298F707C|nr:uncharacterized protein LOC132901969 [Amyelois transitella]